MYCDVQFFQLRSVDLPNLFEDSIQLTEVKKQDISKATAEQNRIKVEIDTLIKSANFQKTVTINLAQGDASAKLQANKAAIDSLRKLQGSKTSAYRNLKKNLNLDNQSLLGFIKSKLVKNTEGSNLVYNLKNPEEEIK